jgi:hypothetical protein
VACAADRAERGQILDEFAIKARLHRAMRPKFFELRPDLIIVYSCNVAQFAEPFSGVPRIMDFGDLDSLKWRQYAKRTSMPLNWIYAIEARRLLGYERHCDGAGRLDSFRGE